MRACVFVCVLERTNVCLYQCGGLSLIRCHAAVPKVFCPKVHCSEGSLVRRFVNPNLGTYFPEKNIGGRPHAGASAACTNSDKYGNSGSYCFCHCYNRERKSRTTLQNKVRLKVLPEQLTLFVNTSVTFKKCIIQ